MTHYRVQEWPDMEGEDGCDAIVFCSDWGEGYWERGKSREWVFEMICGNVKPGDTVEFLEPMHGERPDDYTP